MTPTDTPQEKPERPDANDQAHAPQGRVWVPALKEAAGAFFFSSPCPDHGLQYLVL